MASKLDRLKAGLPQQAQGKLVSVGEFMAAAGLVIEEDHSNYHDCPYHKPAGFEIHGDDIGMMDDDELINHLGKAQRHADTAIDNLGTVNPRCAEEITALKKEAGRRKNLNRLKTMSWSQVQYDLDFNASEEAMRQALELREYFREQDDDHKIPADEATLKPAPALTPRTASNDDPPF